MLRTVDNFLELDTTKTVVVVHQHCPKLAVLIKIEQDESESVRYVKRIVLSDTAITASSFDKKDIASVTSIQDIPLPILRVLLSFDTRFSQWKTGEAVWDSLLINNSECTSFVL